jgi:hypothetical protein
MPQKIKDIIENVSAITEAPSLMAGIIAFERVLDEMDMYAYANWQYGELVKGPVFEKYYMTCTFMWPYTKMPDPTAAKRLLHYGCIVDYEQDKLEVPVKIKTPYDYKPGTKFAKTKLVKVWLVSITIPRDLIDNIKKGTIELENEQLDLEDIEEAYADGVDEDENEGEGENAENQNNEMMPPAVPGQTPVQQSQPYGGIPNA